MALDVQFDNFSLSSADSIGFTASTVILVLLVVLHSISSHSFSGLHLYAVFCMFKFLQDQVQHILCTFNSMWFEPILLKVAYSSYFMVPGALF